MELYIQAHYYASADTMVKLPEDKTWDDVEDVRIKYMLCQIWFKDGTNVEQYMGIPNVDTKWPTSVDIMDEEYNHIDTYIEE